VNRLGRLLRHLFGEDPPPRPTGHVPDRLHRGDHRHHEHEGEGEDPVADAADDGPPPTPHHGH
jgi:hypothetical protein